MPGPRLSTRVLLVAARWLQRAATALMRRAAAREAGEQSESAGTPETPAADGSGEGPPAHWLARVATMTPIAAGGHVVAPEATPLTDTPTEEPVVIRPRHDPSPVQRGAPSPATTPAPQVETRAPSRVAPRVEGPARESTESPLAKRPVPPDVASAPRNAIAPDQSERSAPHTAAATEGGTTRARPPHMTPAQRARPAREAPAPSIESPRPAPARPAAHAPEESVVDPSRMSRPVDREPARRSPVHVTASPSSEHPPVPVRRQLGAGETTTKPAPPARSTVDVTASPARRDQEFQSPCSEPSVRNSPRRMAPAGDPAARATTSRTPVSDPLVPPTRAQRPRPELAMPGDDHRARRSPDMPPRAPAETLLPGAPVWPSHLPADVEISDDRWPSLLAPSAPRPEVLAERAERERARQRRLLAEQRGESWSA